MLEIYANAMMSATRNNTNCIQVVDIEPVETTGKRRWFSRKPRRSVRVRCLDLDRL